MKILVIANDKLPLKKLWAVKNNYYYDLYGLLQHKQVENNFILIVNECLSHFVLCRISFRLVDLTSIWEGTLLILFCLWIKWIYWWVSEHMTTIIKLFFSDPSPTQQCKQVIVSKTVPLNSAVKCPSPIKSSQSTQSSSVHTSKARLWNLFSSLG